MGVRPPSPETLATPRAAERFERFPDLPRGSPALLSQWLEAARIHPVSAVEWHCSREWALGPRVVNDSMWFWIVQGRGRARVGAPEEAPEFPIGSGDLVLIPQGAEHTIRPARGQAFEVLAVHFHAQVFEGINLLDLLGFPNHAPAASGAPYGPASKRLAREYAVRAPGWRSAMSAEILGVLLYLVRHRGTGFRLPGPGRAHAELPRLLPALEWIDRNLPDPALSVSSLARKVFLSEVQFRKLFRRVTSLSPVRFIQRRRVERAGILLRGSELSLEEIAEATGFSDVPFFCRTFKRWYRIPPGRYRKRREP